MNSVSIILCRLTVQQQGGRLPAVFWQFILVSAQEDCVLWDLSVRQGWQPGRAGIRQNGIWHGAIQRTGGARDGGGESQGLLGLIAAILFCFVEFF